MTTIIKATDRDRGIQRVAFNFDDMAAKANQYLDQVRAEAAEILDRARKEAAAIKARAESEGRREGRAAAEAAVEQTIEAQFSKQWATLLPALRQAIREIHHAKHAWLTHWEKSAIHVAASIAGRVIRRPLPGMPEVTLNLIREALELAAGSPQLRIHLHPSDHDAPRSASGGPDPGADADGRVRTGGRRGDHGRRLPRGNAIRHDR